MEGVKKLRRVDISSPGTKDQYIMVLAPNSKPVLDYKPGVNEVTNVAVSKACSPVDINAIKSACNCLGHGYVGVEAGESGSAE